MKLLIRCNCSQIIYVDAVMYEQCEIDIIIEENDSITFDFYIFT